MYKLFRGSKLLFEKIHEIISAIPEGENCAKLTIGWFQIKKRSFSDDLQKRNSSAWMNSGKRKVGILGYLY